MSAKTQWTESMDALLGTMSDRKVAIQVGSYPSRVRTRREGLGIAACHRGFQWTPEIDAILGTMTDMEVAAEIGCSHVSVHLRRRKLGIKTYQQQQRPRRVSRYQQELALPNTLTWDQWDYACEWFEDRCAYCGAEAFLTMDHLVPVSKGGPKTALNILPACWFCNSHKRAKRAHTWIYKRFGMEQGQVIVDRIVAYLTEVKSLLVP